MSDRDDGVMAGYDVIGDVHGHAEQLEKLLEILGFRRRHRAWRHPDRTAVFVGDLIDRRPDQQLATLRLVRSMVDAGSAHVVLGNHEFNAVAFATVNPSTVDYCRPHSDKNRHQHQAFLDEVGFGSPLHRAVVDWFRSLPLWLDLGGLRVVHACWSDADIEHLSGLVSPDHTLTGEVVVGGSTKGTRTYEAVENVLKGPELAMDGAYYFDKDGHRRGRARARWWDATATTLRQAALCPWATRACTAPTTNRCPNCPSARSPTARSPATPTTCRSSSATTGAPARRRRTVRPRRASTSAPAKAAPSLPTDGTARPSSTPRTSWRADHDGRSLPRAAQPGRTMSPPTVRQLRPLTVLVIGMNDERLDVLAEALARVGHRVAYLQAQSDWGDDEGRPEPSGVAVLDGIQANQISSDIDDLVGSLGPLDGVVLGVHTCQVSRYSDTLASLRGAVAEVIGIERQAPWSDIVTRTLLWWGARHGVEVATFRPRETWADALAPPARSPLPIGPVAAAVQRVGWAGPLRLRDVNRVAQRRRRRGEDLLAGRLWRDEGGYDSANSLLIAADAADIDRVRGTLSARDLVGADSDELLDHGIHGVITNPENGIALVEATPLDGPPDAVRVSNVDDEFDWPGEYEPVGRLAVPSGRLVVGNPWEVFDEIGGIEVGLGSAAALDAETYAESGFRLRRVDAHRLIAATELTRSTATGTHVIIRLARDGTATRTVGRRRPEPAQVAPTAFQRVARQIAATGCVDWVEPQPDPTGRDSTVLVVERAGHRHTISSTLGTLDAIARTIETVVRPLGWATAP